MRKYENVLRDVRHTTKQFAMGLRASDPLRPDAWAYSIFLAVDAGLLDPLRMAQALHYTEWGLQRDPVACEWGACGEKMWTSNWVPSIWSARELWPGDNYALALAYFQAGLPDGGWALLQGNMMHDMFHYGTSCRLPWQHFSAATRFEV